MDKLGRWLHRAIHALAYVLGAFTFGALLLILVLLDGCAAKPVVIVPGEDVDLRLHCSKGKSEIDGCVVEDHDATRVYVLTRRAMCAPD